ncbi:MAG: DUF2865 domain-containing protein [Hyphomicrobium sp.]|nr:DUF2865 domain-containing protein [Hyphomicrobium sp.]
MGIVWQLMNSLWWRVAMSFLAGSFTCPQAKAESFFEALFGLGSSKPKVERATPRPGARMGTKAQSYSEWKAERFQTAPQEGDRDPAYGGSFKTVCVRTCDGYYWPVSRSVKRERFETDAKRCDAGCLGEAKLFFQHKDSDDPKTMVDLEGTPYTALKTAFLYRKTLINGCGCRAAPWSMVEQVRHQEYKIADDAKKLQLAVARERDKAAALRKDKIAQIIAATREAVKLDEAEEATFGDAVAAAAIDEAIEPTETIAAVDVDTDPAVSVTGYVHLHMLPDAAIETELAETEPDSSRVTLAELEEALQEISRAPMAVAKSVVPARKSRVKAAKARSSKRVQTVSLFDGFGLFTWPGEAPANGR